MHSSVIPSVLLRESINSCINLIVLPAKLLLALISHLRQRRSPMRPKQQEDERHVPQSARVRARENENIVANRLPRQCSSLWKWYSDDTDVPSSLICTRLNLFLISMIDVY